MSYRDAGTGAESDREKEHNVGPHGSRDRRYSVRLEVLSQQPMAKLAPLQETEKQADASRRQCAVANCACADEAREWATEKTCSRRGTQEGTPSYMWRCHVSKTVMSWSSLLRLVNESNTPAG